MVMLYRAKLSRLREFCDVKLSPRDLVPIWKSVRYWLIPPKAAVKATESLFTLLFLRPADWIAMLARRWADTCEAALKLTSN